MSTKKKLFLSAAGAAGGAGLDVDEVFSTYLYEGNGTPRFINNGIALADGPDGTNGTSTEFDGTNDSLNKSSDLTGNADGKTFTVSFWINPTDDTNTGKRIYHTSGTWRNEIRYGADGAIFVAFFQNESSGGTVFELQSPSIDLVFGAWNHVIFSADMTDTSKRHLYINDVSSSASYTHNNNNIDFTRTTHAIGDDLTAATGNLHGYLAHFFLDYTYRDLSVESNRRTFIDSSKGSTSVSTLSALSPIIYLPMTTGYSVGENEGTGGDFSAVGSPTIANNGTEAESGVGQGGLVWIKNRENQFQDHSLFDTTRSPSYVLYSNTTHASSLSASRFSAFNSDGFSVGTDTSTNESGKDIVSWTFRKASKFFDVVTYTGDGTAGRTISHNLGTTVGSIFIKRTDASSGWRVFHRSEGGTKYAMLQSTNAFASASTVWNNTNPTDSVFTVGSDTDTNGSGGSFVAYLFAHNDGDGEFGPDADQDVIKCGSYTGNGSTSGPEINLGFEPQWLMIKVATGTTDQWVIFDAMRGVATGGDDQRLFPNLSNAEAGGNDYIDFTSTGFKPTLGADLVNRNTSTYIYIAIRRGPLAEPTSATDVFAMDDRSGGPPNAVSGFPVDMGLFTNKASTDNKYIGTRLTQGKRLYTNLTDVEGSSSELAFDYSTGFIDRSDTSTDNIHWMWKRAPSYFDVVTYSGNSSTNTLNHNLGVAPEMIWYKARDGAISWRVHANITSSGYDRLVLNDSAAKIDTETYGSTKELVSQPTATQLVLGSGSGTNNSSSYTYIAYLFATLAGISKVGNFTGTAATQTIDCGFSSGARFVLIKETNTSGGWMVFDTFRGIVSGNDARLELDDTGAESTASDILDPHSSGFQLPSSSFVNASGRECIFYAIA